MSDWIMWKQRLWKAEHVTPLRWHIKSRVGIDRLNEDPWVDTVSFEMDTATVYLIILLYVRVHIQQIDQMNCCGIQKMVLSYS